MYFGGCLHSIGIAIADILLEKRIAHTHKRTHTQKSDKRWQFLSGHRMNNAERDEKERKEGIRTNERIFIGALPEAPNVNYCFVAGVLKLHILCFRFKILHSDTQLISP